MAKRPFQSLRGKVGLALIGACLIGGTSAVLAAHTVNEQAPALAYSSSNSVNNTQSNSTTGSQSTTGSGTATGSTGSGGGGSHGGGGGAPTATNGSSGGGGGANPTATSAGALPTATPRPTATPLTPGGSCNVDGSITAIGSSSFTVHHSGVSYNMSVNSSTTYTFTPLGSTTPQPSTFSALTVGWQTSVSGTAQGPYSCLASTVHSAVDN